MLCTLWRQRFLSLSCGVLFAKLRAKPSNKCRQRPTMNRSLGQSTHQIAVCRLWDLLPLTGVVFLLATSGCAIHRPAPLLVTHQIRDHVSNGLEREVSLKLLTYNIWGLPSWMTGAPPRRYSRIQHDLDHLDPDIILLQAAWTAQPP